MRKGLGVYVSRQRECGDYLMIGQDVTAEQVGNRKALPQNPLIL